MAEFPFNFNFELNEATGDYKHYEGICIDLFDYLSKQLNFTYTLKTSTDGTWNGLLKDLKMEIIDIGSFQSFCREH